MNIIYIDDSAVPLIEGAGGGCFSADTQISIESGTTSISNIEVGDSVWSYDEIGNLVLSKVTETFYHPKDTVYRVTHDFGYLDITPNHWVLKEDGTYQELKDFKVGDNLLTDNNTLSKITSIEFLKETEVYNFKVSHLHAYIANGIKVHNGGGGGKGGASGGVEDPNTLFSTDVLFFTLGLGEGPVYRINPNGPQDIEVNEGNIDDLISFENSTIVGSNQLGGGVKTDRFFTLSNTGSITQQRLPFFGDAVYTPQRLQSGLDLKKGNIAGIPRSALEKQSTSTAAITALKFYFICQGMQKQDDSGNIVGSEATIKVTIYDSTGGTEYHTKEQKIKGKTNVGYSFDMYVPIDEKYYSNSGYKFTVEKTSDDTDTAKKQDSISIQGWTEITEKPIAYTRTATIGYAVKAYAEHKGSLPAITNMVKGLLVKVPTNYNQPIIENGDIDWRQIEVSTNSTNYWTYDSTKNIGGYYQQKTGPTIQTGQPTIYEGVWDGQFVYSWTQNPAWIIYDMLTNSSYGLGIPEKNIDKYSFYDAAVYCDACDVTTGKFVGVDALSDGSYRYKPRGYRRRLVESLIGLDAGLSVKERRFILDTVIADQKQVMDIINTLTLTFRAILYYTGGKIALYQDRPDDMPVAVFNETNIIAGTMNISGVGEESLLTGVDISYNEATNHYRRETLRVDDSKALKERNYIENIAKIDLTGITRKSQALRLAQYVIAESKYSRRKIGFKTGMEASDLYPGAVISIAQKSTSVNWGYGGIVSNTSPSTNANVYLEYIGNPAISNSFFTSNTGPLLLRIASSNSGLIDSYIISNNLSDVSLISSGNTFSTPDIIRVKAISKYSHPSKTFNAFNGTWGISHNPSRKDLWTLGEISNPNNIYSSQSDKLFRIINIKRDKDETVFIEGKEYVNNVYIDSDTTINYEPLYYNDFFSPLQPPPPPNFTISPVLKRDNDGSIYTDLEISSFTDTTGYSKEIKTEFSYATPESVYSLVSNASISGSNKNIINIKLSNVNGITNGTSATLIGKSGFTTEAGTARLLVTGRAIANTSPADPKGNIALTVPGLRSLIDTNFYPNTHLFNVISTFGLALKGKTTVSIPVRQKADTANLLVGFINYASAYNTTTVEVLQYIPASDTILIKNTVNNGTELINILPSDKFYISARQILDQGVTANYLGNTMFVTGSSYELIRKNTITTTNIVDQTFYQPLGVSIRDVDFIDVTINGNTQGFSTVSLLNNGTMPNSLVSVSLNTLPTEVSPLDIEVRASVYTVPLIERGDNVIFSTGTIRGVTATSYDIDSPIYNAYLTANCVYKIAFEDLTPDTVSGSYVTNITANPVGTINNVSAAANTFTFDYTASNYPGLINLANNSVYTIATPALTFKPLSFGEATTRTINRVSYGTHFISARTVNKYGRRSPIVTKSATVRAMPIQGVTNLSISEELRGDLLFGITVRAIISFRALSTLQEVTDYEVSYKIESSDTTLNTNYQSIKVTATSTDTDGFIRIRVDNIDVGSSNAKNYIVARVTPLNRTIRGSTVVLRQQLVGKTAPPSNILNFDVGQTFDHIYFKWDLPKDPKTGLNLDLDLATIVVRRVAGIYDVTTADLTYLWTISEPLKEFNSVDNSKSTPIDQFGPFTYLVKTVDTSGNPSSTIVAYAYTSVQRSQLVNYASYSEDNPSVAFVTGVDNYNLGEYNFPSFANSNNYGFYNKFNASIAGSFNASKVDNANGTSTGWSVIGSSPTNIRAVSNATYQTQIRDIGAVISATLYLDTYGYQGIKTTWMDQMTTIKEGVTEAYTTLPGNMLRDDNLSGTLGIGNILGYANVNAATVTYDPKNRTLVSGLVSSLPANVFAITTGSGNFNGDVANANILCFISGVNNANSVVLGPSFYANGKLISNSSPNGFSNLSIAGSKYKLVDLKQWVDLSSSDTFVGALGQVLTNTQVRYATANPFTSTGNVLNNVFTQSSNSDGYASYVVGTKTFRYFQIKHNIINNNPGQVDYTLDRLNYKVSLDSKVFQSTVTVDSLVKFVDYSSQSYTKIPTITGLVVSRSSNAAAFPAAVVIDKGLTGANLSVYFSSNGVSAHNIGLAPQVDITISGV